MKHETICDWLGLAGEAWPPDHYRLLGLEPGEVDAARIEQQVHDRLEIVRRYQLLHPEVATEAMNRLAQAFVCLTDPEAKKAYDARFAAAPATPAAMVEEDQEQSDATHDPLAWLYAGPGAGIDPTRAVTQLELPTPRNGAPSSPPREASPSAKALDDTGQRAGLIPPPVRRIPGSGPAKHDPILEAAHESPTARRGLGTKRALYHRVACTRRLLRAWNEAGPYVGHPGRRLNKPVEATDLIHALITLRTQLKSFPPLLGQAGQPGYLVVALARQQVIVPTFQTLLPSQREALARDWRAGLKLLHAHLQFLREELRTMRERGMFNRTIRAMRSMLLGHFGLLLLLLAGLAVVVALWRSFASDVIDSLREPEPEAGPPVQVAAGPTKQTRSSLDQARGKRPPDTLREVDHPTTKPASDTPPPAAQPDPPPEPVKSDDAEQVLRFRAEDQINCIRGAVFLARDQFVYCNGTKQVVVQNTANSGDHDRITVGESIQALAACPVTGKAACGDENGRLYLVPAADLPHAPVELHTEHDRQVSALAFSHDGKKLVSAGKDGKVLLWDTEKRELIRPIAVPNSPAEVVAISSDGATVVWGCDDGIVRIWDGKEVVEAAAGAAPRPRITALALTPDGKSAYSGDSDGVIRSWNLAKLTESSERKKLDGKVTSLAFSPDGRTYVTSDAGKNIKIWDTDTGKELGQLEGPNEPICTLAFSPDGKRVLAGLAGGKMILWPLK
jgi:hypothetical protein